MFEKGLLWALSEFLSCTWHLFWSTSTSCTSFFIQSRFRVGRKLSWNENEKFFFSLSLWQVCNGKSFNSTCHSACNHILIFYNQNQLRFSPPSTHLWKHVKAFSDCWRFSFSVIENFVVIKPRKPRHPFIPQKPFSIPFFLLPFHFSWLLMLLKVVGGVAVLRCKERALFNNFENYMVFLRLPNPSQ